MKKLLMTAVIAALAVITAGNYEALLSKDAEKAPGLDADKKPSGVRDQKKTKADPGDRNAADQDLINLEDRELEIDEREDRRLESELERETRQYRSLRKKKDEFSFHVTFSIGGLGYGVVGGLMESEHELYRIRYVKGSFIFGFRGGMEGMFYLNRINCFSLGVFYEQRKQELKINYIPLTGIIIPQNPDQIYLLYYAPIEKYVAKSVVDLNYLALPVTYRYYLKEEFYIGLGLDIALLLQGKTNFSIFLLKSSINLKNFLSPIDLGGRIVFGFIMNRIFIEAAVGTGILKLDTMHGERRSMYLTAMIGYRI